MSGSGMDVDDESSEVFERGLRTDTVFSKSKEMTVTFYAQLPVEVKQALRSAGTLVDIPIISVTHAAISKTSIGMHTRVMSTP